MCGISGIFSKNLINQKSLFAMNQSQFHRGPDGSGIEIRQQKNINIGFAHRRLAVLDLSSAANQPMFDINKNFMISFNGEIYNHLEIKNILIEKGYQFLTASDTEVLLYGFIEFKEKILQMLNGMFAFAIYDFLKKKLFIARDKMGQKPLHYFITNENFVFSSEIKGILNSNYYKKKISYDALNHFLSYEYVPNPMTIFEGIYKLPQASYAFISLENNDLSMKTIRYSTPKFQNKIISDEEAIYLLESKLRKAVHDRLMSDVPLGIFLSGGIDSSALIALLSSEIDTRELKTFSVGFKESSYDERTHANTIARLFKTQHHEQILDAQRMIEIIPKIFTKLDEPFADASIIPTFLLSQFTREHVTIALGGDGGDELFSGYDPFLAHYFANKFEKFIPQNMSKKIAKILQKLPVSNKNMSFEFRLKTFIAGLYQPVEIRNQIWMGAFNSNREIFQPHILEQISENNPYKILTDFSGKNIFANWNDKISAIFQEYYLSDDILVKIDRASMLNSLEARSPFLDSNVVDFANNLPMKMKFRNLTRKYILKKMLENKLPNKIIHRKKKGFGIPLTSWINNELKDEITHTLSKKKIDDEGIFNSSYTEKILKEHQNNKKDNRKQIWSLYIFHKWKEAFLH